MATRYINSYIIKDVIGGLFAVIGSMAASDLSAQQVQPMSFNLQPFGQGAETTLTINNTTEGALTVEVLPTEIDLSEDGIESRKSADDAFLIFPPNAVIESGSSQAVRVRYIGEAEIETSKSYRISVKQVPVDLRGTGETAIGIAVNFNTLVNVVPANAKPEPNVQSIEASSDEGYWNLTLENSGTRYVRLSKTDWTVRDNSGQTTTLNGEQVDEMLNGNLLLPNSARNFKIQALDGFAPEATEILIEPQ